MRQLVINEEFFKKIAEKGNLYSRIWIYWLGGFVDSIFDSDFLEKQQADLKNVKFVEFSEIREIYHFGVQILQQDFQIIEKKKKKKIIPNEQVKIASQIIDYLNEKAKTKFTKKNSNIELIVGRLNEGFTTEDFYMVIDKKVKEWMGTDFQQYLRPVTIFSAKLFENYLNSNNERTATSFDKFALAVAKAQSFKFCTDE